jgi:hypothetical protein
MQEVSGVQLFQGEDECVFVLKQKSRDFLHIGNGCESTIEDNYSESLPIYYLKDAAGLLVGQAGVPALDLKFEGKRVLMHTVRSVVTKGCTDSSRNGAAPASPSDINDFKHDFALLEIYRIPTEDNEGLAKRLADAFKHAAELCAGKQPKSNEPF